MLGGGCSADEMFAEHTGLEFESLRHPCETAGGGRAGGGDDKTQRNVGGACWLVSLAKSGLQVLEGTLSF